MVDVILREARQRKSAQLFANPCYAVCGLSQARKAVANPWLAEIRGGYELDYEGVEISVGELDVNCFQKKSCLSTSSGGIPRRTTA